MNRQRYGILLSAALLSGCLVSEEPLIRDSDSVTPLADGTYSFVSDGAEKQAVVSHAGAVTRITATDDDGESETSEMRMARLERGYYVVMGLEDGEDVYHYSLLRRERRRFTMYASERHCRRLQELWLVGGKTPADVGVVVDGGAIPSCRFTSYERLADAFRDLLADGNLEPSISFERQ